MNQIAVINQQFAVSDYLDYDAATGIFTWRVDRNNRVKAGSRAGSVDAGGYVIIPVNRKNYKAHRLAWLYVNGEWPRGPIDHINCDKTDNRIANLREATPAENAANRPRRSNGRSGFKGVSWCSREGKWVASIRHDGRHRHLGYFTDAAEAHAVYAEAARTTFGEFARTA